MMWGLHAPLRAEHNHHGIVLILAFFQNGSGTRLHALFVCDDGRLRTGPIDDLTSETRYDWNTHTWEDVPEGDFYDETSDGGPEIPGDVPDLDRADRSDPSDQGDGAARGVDTE